MEEGELVLINYVGKTEDGEIFDLTLEEKAKKEDLYNADAKYEPIPVLVGRDYVIEGLDEQIKKMSVGDEAEVEIPKEKAYGKRETSNIETYPEKEFKKQGVSPNPGEELMIGNRRGRVISNNSGRVRIDFNHPLAGQDLNYWVEIVEEIEDDEDKAEKILDFKLGHGEMKFEDDKAIILHKHEDEEHSHTLPEEFKEDLKNDILENTGFEEVEFDE